jgi:hypothetical protein
MGLIRFLRTSVIQARPKRSCEGGFPLSANSMAGSRQDTPVRMSWAFAGSVGGNPAETASCSLAQGMPTPPVGGVALLSIPCYWPKAINLRGLGTGPQEPPKYAKTG